MSDVTRFAAIKLTELIFYAASDSTDNSCSYPEAETIAARLINDIENQPSFRERIQGELDNLRFSVHQVA